MFLRDVGADPAIARVRAAIDLVRGNVTWGAEFGDSPFLEGEVEPCINGRVVTLGAYFGERSDRLVDRLLGEQPADGGWNCEAERGSVRSSFHTTICVLEGLLAFENAFGATTPVTDALGRGQEYLLERRLLRPLSTGGRSAESLDHAARSPRAGLVHSPVTEWSERRNDRNCFDRMCRMDRIGEMLHSAQRPSPLAT